MLPHEHAKREMKRKGWSYRRAALRIGKGYPWVCAVLNGHGTSQPVIDAILALPESPTPYRPLGFARLLPGEPRSSSRAHIAMLPARKSQKGIK